MGVFPRLLNHHLAARQRYLLPDRFGQEHQLYASYRGCAESIWPRRCNRGFRCRCYGKSGKSPCWRAWRKGQERLEK